MGAPLGSIMRPPVVPSLVSFSATSGWRLLRNPISPLRKTIGPKPVSRKFANKRQAAIQHFTHELGVGFFSFHEGLIFFLEGFRKGRGHPFRHVDWAERSTQRLDGRDDLPILCVASCLEMFKRHGFEKVKHLRGLVSGLFQQVFVESAPFLFKLIPGAFLLIFHVRIQIDAIGMARNTDDAVRATALAANGAA